jgi:type IV pilus assembly protein PilO
MNYEMLRETIGARRNSFVFAAFLLLLNLAILLYLSVWQRPELAKAQTEWFAKRDALASGRTVLDADRYRAGMLDLAEFQKRVIPKKGFAGFLGELFETAHNNSLRLKGITYKPAVMKEEGLVAYGISFSVVGKYASVKSFLADMARYPEIVTVDSVALSNSSQTEEQVDLKVQMTAYLKVEGT